MKKKNPWRFVCLGAAILSGLWLAVDRLLPWLVIHTLPRESASIGIIGGADGPTAIFLTARPGNFWEQALPVVILTAGIAGFILLSRNAKKSKDDR